MRTPIRLPCQGGVAQRKAEGLPSTIRLQVIKKDHPQRCLPIRKHREAREKRYSFGYAVFLILALMK